MKTFTGAERAAGNARSRAYREMVHAEHEAWVKGGMAVPDFTVTVLWVWASLGVDRPVGCPGPVARQMLRWARRNRKEFFGLFASKLMPGGVGRNGTSPIPAEDPGLSLLDEVMKRHKKPEGGEG